MKPFTIYDCLCFVWAGIVRMDVKIASSIEVVLPIDLEILPQQGRPFAGETAATDFSKPII